MAEARTKRAGRKTIGQTKRGAAGRGAVAKPKRGTAGQGAVAKPKRGTAGQGAVAKPKRGTAGRGAVAKPKRGTAGRGAVAKPKRGAAGQGSIQLPDGGAPGAQQGAPFDAEVLVLGEEIRALKKEAGAESVETKVEIGKRLRLVRARLVHGQWERFVKTEVSYARQRARDLIQLAEWAPRHWRVLQQIKHLGPTKVYTLMKAPADSLKQLLKRKQHIVPGDTQTKKLDQLSVAELSRVLKTLGSELPPEEMAPRVEAKEVLDELLRDAKRVVRGTNALLKLRDELPDPVAAEQQVAEVHKRLLRSLKKLDKAFEIS